MTETHVTIPTPRADRGPSPEEPPTTAATLLLNLDEVAEQLRCTRRRVERYIAAGRLFALHIGRSVRVERRELDAFVARMRAREPRYGQTA